jgi:hypothetical protein
LLIQVDAVDEALIHVLVEKGGRWSVRVTSKFLEAEADLLKKLSRIIEVLQCKLTYISLFTLPSS